MRVLVPLCKKNLRVGVIMGLEEDAGERELKNIFWPLEKVPLLPSNLLAMIRDLSLRQGITPGYVLGHVLPYGLRQPNCLIKKGAQLLASVSLATFSKEMYEQYCADLVKDRIQLLPARTDVAANEQCVLLVDPPWPVRPAARRQLAVLDYLYQTGSINRKLLQQKLGVPCDVLKNLEKQNLIRLEYGDALEEENRGLLPPPEASFELNDAQKEALSFLTGALQMDKPATSLLYGVTGSGKTAVYLELARKAIESGRSVLLLAPEVALAHKLFRDASLYLPDLPVYMYHGYQSSQKREKLFRLAAAGAEACLVIGTRSALFLPLRNTGCIIIDEEHDASYKQDETLTYNAKELAWFKMRQSNGLLVLGSATPDIKSFYAARNGLLPMLELRKRVGGLPLPPIELIKIGLKSGFNTTGKNSVNLLSKECEKALLETIDRGEQAVVLLNRRGYAPLMYCLECGKTVACPDCGIGMAFHKSRQKLVCHYCGNAFPHPSPCPECGGLNFLPLGEGTEKLAEHLGILAGQPILRLDRDNTRRPGKIEEILASFAAHESPILVGTQMLSKGHHFPNVTLAIVADGDIGLNLPDYRATERTFQLLLQVAGRPGRGSKPGCVLIQTRDPSHYCWQYLVNNDYEGFYQEELARRQKRVYPPFIRLALLRISFPRENEAGPESITLLAADMRPYAHQLGVKLLGPTPSPIPMLRGHNRFQCLIKATEWQSIRDLANFARTHPAAKKLRISLDLDPVNML